MNKTIFIQFTAGKGPTECAVACKKVFEYFADTYIDIYHFKIIDCEEDYEQGYRSIIIELPDMTESNINELQNKWEGTIKYICTKNTIRSNHKRKNWFVGINIFESPKDIFDTNINPKDLKWNTMRSHGPGGQHVNMTESAVRVTHISSGISVRCDASRNQVLNKETAVKLLIAKLNCLNNSTIDEQKNLIWMNHNLLERGNEKMIIKGEL